MTSFAARAAILLEARTFRVRPNIFFCRRYFRLRIALPTFLDAMNTSSWTKDER
jgi:hypothetical protein